MPEHTPDCDWPADHMGVCPDRGRPLPPLMAEGSSVGAPWPAGVAGMQCDECSRTTVCREFGVGQEEDGDSEWLCRPCYVGDLLPGDCLCETRVSGDGKLIVIRDADCDVHHVSILDAT